MPNKNPPKHEPPPKPFPKDYWDAPEALPKGDVSPDQTYHAVGWALSGWETAEIILANIFLIMSECETQNSYNAVRRAFGSIESSAGRRKALEATAEIYFGHAWTNQLVKKTFGDASRRRDEIAHGVVIPIAINSEPMGSFLFPPEYNTQRTHAYMNNLIDPLAFMRGKYRYTAPQIMEIGAKFSALRLRLLNYVFKIKKVNGSPAQLWYYQIKDQPQETIDAFCHQYQVAWSELIP
jgi:hypothetical protein